MVNKATKQGRLPAVLAGVGTSGLVLLVLVAAAYGLYAFSYSGTIFPNTMVAGVNVGGLDEAAAEALLVEKIRSFEQAPMSVIVAGTPVMLSPSDVDASYDAAVTVAAAYAVGRSGDGVNRVLAQLRAAFRPTDIPLSVTYSSEALTKFLDDVGHRLNDEAANAGVEYRKGRVVVTPEHAGNQFNRILLEQVLTEALDAATPPPVDLTFPLQPFQPSIHAADIQQLLPIISVVVSRTITLTFEELSFTITPDQLTEWVQLTSVSAGSRTSVEGFFESTGAVLIDADRGKITAYAKTLADEIAREPVDARLSIQNGKATVFAAAQDGRALEEAATVQAVADVLLQRRTSAKTGTVIRPASVPLPVTITKPTVTSSTVDDLGIKELIGTATTDFTGSPDNRVHNIGTGLKYLNGWLVKPSDEFSTVKALGAVDGSTGYLPELVIKENKTIPEFGGGLCQVSTTLFRSVMNAGLPITERQNHSYRVVYYERGIGPGLDATVYLPRPDFRFKNDTPGWILIQGAIKGKNLTFELYGTSDGRTASIDGPHTLSTTPAPPTVYETNSALAPGEQKEVGHAHPGATTTATYTVTRAGEVINQQTFLSKYKAIAAIIQEGPKADAAPTPESAAPAVPAPAPELVPAPTPDQPAQQ